MNATKALETIEQFLVSEADALTNYLIEGTNLGDGAVKAFRVTSDLGVGIREDVRKQVRQLADREFVPYDPSYQTSSSQVLVERLDAIPPLAAVDQIVRNGDVDGPTDGQPVVAMAHKVGTGPEQLVAYRLKGAGIATRRSRRAGLLLPGDGGVYAPVSGTVLFYEPRFDAMTCGDYAFFVTVSLIQSKLESPQKSMKLARDTYARATADIEIDGFSDLENAVVNDPSMRAKMAQLARLLDAEPEYAVNLTTQNLVMFIEQNPDYGVATAKMGGRTVLKFDPSSQHRYKIPKLLADDYLVSELTRRKYEAGSKQRILGA